MRMLILIKREIVDHIGYFIAAAILSALFIVLCISLVIRNEAGSIDWPELEFGLAAPIVALVLICITAMGASQMHNDKNSRISAFLSTLPTSRSAILTARVIAGLIAILLVVLPVSIGGYILVGIIAPPVPIFTQMLTEIAITAFLMCVACYCMGLLTGWTSSRILPTLGALVLVSLIIPLIIIKGFGLQIEIILLLFIIASLSRTWCKFSSTSL